MDRNQSAKAKYFCPAYSLVQFFIICLLKPVTQTHNAFSGHLLLLLEPALVLEPLPMGIPKTQLVVVLGSLLCLPLLEQGSWTRQPPEIPINLIQYESCHHKADFQAKTKKQDTQF